jgi:hypothetical protein
MSATTTTTSAPKTINPALYVEYATTLEQFNTLRETLDKITANGGSACQADAFSAWHRAWNRLDAMRPAGRRPRPQHRVSTGALVRHQFALDQHRILKDTSSEIAANLNGRAMSDGERAIFDACTSMRAHLKKTRARLKEDRPWLDETRARMKATRAANLAVFAAAERERAERQSSPAAQARLLNVAVRRTNETVQ